MPIQSVTSLLFLFFHFLFSFKIFKHFLSVSLISFILWSCCSFELLANNNPTSMNDEIVTTGESLEQEEITISSYHYIKPIASVIAPTIILTREDIARQQMQSVVEVLRRLPGINLAQSGGVGQQTSLFVRGTESRHVLVLIDGIRLNQANISGAPDVSQIPLSMIQKIEYIRGARSALYGSDAIGGVINLITYPENKQETKGQLTLGLGSFDDQRYDITQQISTSDTIINGALSFHRSQGTDAVANMPEAGGNRQTDKDGFKNYFGWFALAHQFTDRLSGHIRAYAFNNKNKYDGFNSYIDPNALIDERELQSQSIDGRVNWVEGRYGLEVIATHNVTNDYNFDRKKGKKHITASNDKANLNQFQVINSLRHDGGTINLGAEWQQQTTEQIQPGELKSSHLHLTNNGIFITGQQTYNKWITELALRHDEQSQFGGHQTYHLGISHPFIFNTDVSFSYGHAYKAPNLLQLYSQYGGNSELKPEESMQYELGLNGELQEINFKFSAYHNEIKELIDYQNTKFINIGLAEIKGAELEFTKEFDMFSHELSLTYLDAKDKRTGNRLPRRAQKQLNYLLNFNKDALNAGVSYHYEGRRNDIRFLPDQLKNEIVKLPINQQFDLSLSYDFTTHVTIRGRIADMFNQQRETVYGYQPTGRAFYITGEYRF